MTINRLICLKILNKKIDTRMVVLTTISTVLLLLRVKITHSIYLLFLLWNLFLAIIPYAISLQIKNNILIKRNKFLKLIYYFLWLGFFPNTFYLITDFVHLYHSSSRQFIFDAILLSTFTIAGFYIGIASMNHIHTILKSKYSYRISVFIMIIICYSCAFGIYLGRILRFNSWDIICNPIELIQSIINCISISDSYVFTVVLGTLILILYLIIHNKKKSTYGT